MGANIACTLAFFLIASFCIAYLATIGLRQESDFMDVFRFVGTAGILTFCAGGIPNRIWFKRKMRGDLLDGLVYGLLTGLIFASLWPAAS